MTLLRNIAYWRKYEKSSKKKFQKKFKKKFKKKCLKKSLLKKFENITNCRRGVEGCLGEGRGGMDGGELSFQCLRPSTSLMAAGKKSARNLNLYDFCHSPKKLAAVSPFTSQRSWDVVLSRHWKDLFKSDFRSDQDHHLKNYLRSDQDQFF
jgi:hypothetical protein